MQSKLDFIYSDAQTIGSRNNVGAPDNRTLPRHRWYFFKEAFSPQVVELAIKENLHEPNHKLIDPFSGSGTSVLTSLLKGYCGIGLEVNPFLAFVANAKIANCESETIDKYLQSIVNGAKIGANSPLERFSTFTEAANAERWLFNSEILRAFEGGWQASELTPKPARELIQLCLIAAAMDVCNVEKDGKCVRYKRNWQKRGYNRADFISSFEQRIENVKSDLRECPLQQHQSQIYLADSRQEEAWTQTGLQYDLCVMSPPYLNSFDYTDVYRPELFLGRFVKTHEELTKLRMRTLRSHVSIKWPHPTDDSFGASFTDSLRKINEHADSLWNDRIPLMVQAYFEDMKRLLEILWRQTTRNAQVWIVVSTSAYAGIEIPVDVIIGDIGERIGWKVKELSTIRYLRRVAMQQLDRLNEAKQNKPHLRESLILLDRSQ